MGQGASPPPGQRRQPLRSHPPALQWPFQGCGSAPQPAHRYALVQRLHRSAAHLDFELQCVGGNCAVAVETATADAVRDEILETYRIPSAASRELGAEQ